MNTYINIEDKARNIVGEKIIKLTKTYDYQEWNWNSISSNPNITMDFIEKYPDKPWDWKCIYMNANITMDFIEKYQHKPCNWECISMNKNMTIELIEKYNDKLNFKFLYNFEQDYKNELEKLVKETFKTVLNEFMEVCLMPDNMKMMKGLGVYSDISW